MHFTRTPLKNKKPVNYGTNKMGQYYSNERVPIKNYHRTPLTKRIDKNMTNLYVPDQPTNINLNSLLKPVLNTDNSNTLFDFNNKETPTIFNYSYDNVPTSIAEKLRDYEDEKIESNINEPTSILFKITEKHSDSFVNKVNENMYFEDFNDRIANKETEMQEYIKKQQIDIPLKLLQLTKPIIENVYQEQYNNAHATGLGDFIRGSYFLLEFCGNNNIPCNINILNHPISQFLEIYKNKQPLIYNNINKFELTNHNPDILNENIITNIYDPAINDEFIKYLSKQHVFEKKLYVYTIAYPSSEIDPKYKEYMQKILKPSMRLKSLVDNMLLNLGLVSKQFTIIHIRYGDDFLIKNKEKIKKSHLEIIQNRLDKLNLSQKYLLISDNTILKYILSLKYPFLKIHLNEITHTGEGLHIETNKLQNTMIDFNMFSHAASVIAFSVYKHGTGFSKWAAETYSVPYICRFLH